MVPEKKKNILITRTGEFFSRSSGMKWNNYRVGSKYVYMYECIASAKAKKEPAPSE